MHIPHYDEVNPGQIFTPGKTIYNFTVALVNDLIDKINDDEGSFLTLAEYNSIVPDWYDTTTPDWYETEVPAWYDITIPTWASSIAAGLPVFNTKALAIAGTIGSSVDAVYVANYGADGDLGGGMYIKVGTEPAHDFKFQNTANGFWYEINEKVLLPQMVGGALQDTAADSGPMLRSLIFACVDLEREGYIPKGVYNLISYVEDAHGDRFGLLAEDLTWLRLKGAGKGSTIFSVDPSASINIFGITACSNIYLEGFYCRGKGSTGGAATGLHGADTLSNINVRDVRCGLVPGYGFGWEDGTFTFLTIENCQSINVGSDAMDFKNFYEGNHSIKIVNWYAEDFGQEEPNESGLDIRGIFNVVNYTARGVAGDCVGVRLQLNGQTEGDHAGARWSALSNLDLFGSADWGVNDTIGVEVWGQRTAVTNGSIRGFRWGYHILEHSASEYNVVSNLVIEDCRTGILIQGHHNAVSNCVTIGCTTYGLSIDGSPSLPARVNTVNGLVCANPGAVTDIDLSLDSNYNVIVGGRGHEGASNNGTNNTINVGDNFSIP